MGWFKKNETKEKKIRIPEGFWAKCNNCNEIIIRKEIERNLNVCPKCNYHFRIPSKAWIEILCDAGSFVELFANIESADPLNFRDSKSYKDRLKEAKEKLKMNEAVITGEAKIDGISVSVGILEFDFMGGSMGSVVGEKITRLIERSLELNKPLIIVSSSGGARMQESILSLMQMAKTSAALALLKKKGIPYISIMTDPTTGGVAASFAFLGDIIIAEPKALIGFAGPRVIEQTIKQKLPEGFQRAEFLLEHGFIDMIVERRQMKSVVSKILRLLVG